MTLRRNRYHPEGLLKQLSGQKPTLDANEWCFRFKCPEEDIDDFEVCVPEGEAEQKEARKVLTSLLGVIDRLDNLAQDSFEDEAVKSRYGIENFVFYIGYIDLRSERVRFRYYGTNVNDERVAEFHQDQKGDWQKTNC